MRGSGCASGRGGERGFTLLEILIALMIAGIGLAALSGLISSGLGLSSMAERTARETSLARSALSRFGTELPLAPGEQTGELAQGYHWRSDIRRLDPDSPAGALHVALVSVTVWDANEQDPGVRLTTMRLLNPLQEGAP